MTIPRLEIDPDYDPFAAFNENQGAGAVRNPYPLWAGVRAATPVYSGDPGVMMGIDPDTDGDGAPFELPDDMAGMFMAVGYDAVREVLRDGATFSSTVYESMMGPVMGHTILEMDEPEHHRYRALLQQAFTKREMERWESELVVPTVSGLIDQFVDSGRADLVDQLTFPFPVHVIAGLLGLPERDLDAFHRLAVQLIGVMFDWDRGIAASETLRAYFAAILEERRADPRDDMISALAGVELDGEKLTDDEIFAFLLLLLPAGAETTYRSSSNLLFGLLTNPDQLDELKADRSLMGPAIEEGLRWEPPLTGIARMTLTDTELCGVKIPKGSVVSAGLGAANHDDTRWENPEAFDIHREPQPHAAFAFGAHTCLGMHLARMETTVVVNAILDRLPNVRLDPDAEDVHIAGGGFRAPAVLPVVFD